jgi:hypothetical protein
MDTQQLPSMITGAPPEQKHMKEMRDIVDKGDASALAALLTTYEVRPYLCLLLSFGSFAIDSVASVMKLEFCVIWFD